VALLEAVKLSDQTFREIRDLVYRKSGIYIQDTKKYLIENRLQKRLQQKNLRSFEDYLYLLKYDTGDEQIHLFNLLTTRETSFFREPMLLEAFSKEILPRVIADKGGGGLRIWSAGCSTGEEPYTLAMFVLESSNGTRPPPTRIYATDLSRDAIVSARRAVYGDYAIRNTGPQYLKKYFVAVPGGFTVIPEVKRMVQFEELNLLDENAMRRMRDMDVIFCRNTMIYFDNAAKQKVASYFYDALRPGGYLFVGASESLHSVSRAFKPVAVNRTVVYRKE